MALRCVLAGGSGRCGVDKPALGAEADLPGVAMWNLIGPTGDICMVGEMSPRGPLPLVAARSGVATGVVVTLARSVSSSGPHARGVAGCGCSTGMDSCEGRGGLAYWMGCGSGHGRGVACWVGVGWLPGAPVIGVMLAVWEA